MAVKNEVGNTYGYLTVIERMENDKNGRAMWKCRCKCGNEVVVMGKRLRSGNTKSCGCYQREKATQSNLERGSVSPGQRYGKLVVLEEAGFTTDSYNKRRRLWKCQCDCGNICSIQGVYLASGDTNSCGCINSVGNMTITRLLNLFHVNYISEYSFYDLLTEKGNKMRFDFAILDEQGELLGLIEYQGDIHFKYNNRNKSWNTKDAYEIRVERDRTKEEYCKEKNIKLYYITYLDNIREKLEEILDELRG